jgi:hypothetical protein
LRSSIWGKYGNAHIHGFSRFISNENGDDRHHASIARSRAFNTLPGKVDERMGCEKYVGPSFAPGTPLLTMFKDLFPKKKTWDFDERK